MNNQEVTLVLSRRERILLQSAIITIKDEGLISDGDFDEYMKLCHKLLPPPPMRAD